MCFAKKESLLEEVHQERWICDAEELFDWDLLEYERMERKLV